VSERPALVVQPEPTAEELEALRQALAALGLLEPPPRRPPTSRPAAPAP
jgi:hypothetical protein